MSYSKSSKREREELFKIQQERERSNGGFRSVWKSVLYEEPWAGEEEEEEEGQRGR